MRKALFVLVLSLFASASFAGEEDAVVRWKTIVGVITAPLVNNPVAGRDKFRWDTWRPH